jgi:Tol biopolymer transport system component
VIRPDGSGLAQLTSGPASDSRPAWSPDGWSVVFSRVASPGGGTLPSSLFVVKYNGYGLRQVTVDAGVVDEYPTWSRW